MLSIYDDPYIQDGMGSHLVDAEGVKTKRRPLIHRGVFENTYSNLFDYYHVTNGAGAGRVPQEGLKPSGNAVRMAMPVGRSAYPVPFSAPHNLVVEPGGISRDEMLQDTKKGLLVGRLWYTYAVNPIKGDFSCTARSGVALLKNGEVVSPTKPVRIMHSLPALLQNVSGVGDDPVSVIQWASLPSFAPSVRIDDIPVRCIS